jgi:hypothetical protein
MRSAPWIAVWFLSLAGCGGGGPASQADLASYCDAECAWQARCKTPELDCVNSCHKKTDAHAAIYVGGYFRAAADCWRNGACDTKGDTCSAAGVLALNEPTRDRDFAACMNARSACQAAKKETFSDDDCYVLPALTDAARDHFASCFVVSCELQRSCANTALGD